MPYSIREQGHCYTIVFIVGITPTNYNVSYIVKNAKLRRCIRARLAAAIYVYYLGRALQNVANGACVSFAAEMFIDRSGWKSNQHRIHSPARIVI